ncbi:hypothetical protein SKAU_G00052100 [Synaphobranchus kaupii]|uniref:Uncharacterized protein n=1 Tax=Synaphobranchus kaupii TaxID=118154 RepID=A0A9Q1G4M1_SYNKA|nr:hypothetical protein SKAU_G00052100 [Synaphobranchus kaupii]
MRQSLKVNSVLTCTLKCRPVSAEEAGILAHGKGNILRHVPSHESLWVQGRGEQFWRDYRATCLHRLGSASEVHWQPDVLPWPCVTAVLQTQKLNLNILLFSPSVLVKRMS